MKKKIIVALSIVILICSISLVYLQHTANIEPEHVTLVNSPGEDVEYGKNIRYKKTKQKNCNLDIAYKNDNKKKPIIIFVHGGSWIGGSKDEFEDLVLTFANEGYVAATIDYDLIKMEIENKKDFISVTDEIESVDAAVEFLVEHKDEYQIDEDNIFILGHSAGGQLVGNLAERVATDKKEHAYQFKGVILMAAAANLRSYLYDDSVKQDNFSAMALLSFVFDGNFENDIITEIDKVDVTSNITPEMASTLLIHGNMDDVISYRESEKLYKAMKDAGCKVEIEIIDNATHGIDHQRVADTVKAFIVKEVQEADK